MGEWPACLRPLTQQCKHAVDDELSQQCGATQSNATASVLGYSSQPASLQPTLPPAHEMSCQHHWPPLTPSPVQQVPGAAAAIEARNHTLQQATWRCKQRSRGSWHCAAARTLSCLMTLAQTCMLIAALTVSPAALVSAAANDTAPTAWTLLGYIMADNDLECDIMGDLAEMAVGMSALPLGAPVDVFLNVDRWKGVCDKLEGALAGSLPTSSWTSVRDVALRPGGAWQVVQDFGEVNQASSSALAAFLQRALARYPPTAGRKYMFLLSDHGLSFEGSGMDVTCVASLGLGGASQAADTAMKVCGWLQLPAILEGMQRGMAGSGLQQFDIMSFDSCLMANWEVATTMQPVAARMLFSEQLVPATGMDYRSLANFVGSGGVLPSPQQVTDFFTRSYIASCLASGSGDCIMTALDARLPSSSSSSSSSSQGPLPGTLQALNANLVAMSAQWSTDMATNPALAGLLMAAGLQALRVTKAFGSVVDLGSFLARLQAALLASTASPAEVQQLHGTRLTQLAATWAAYNSCTVTTNANAGQLTGMSLYWPRALDSSGTGVMAFLGPLETLSPAVSAWVDLVDATFRTAASLRQPFEALLSRSAPWLPSPSWTPAAASPPLPGGQPPPPAITVTAELPGPLLLAGDLLVGALPGSVWGLDPTALTVLRVVSASPSADNTKLSATWDGTVYGLQQTLAASGLPPITAPVYMEVDSNTAGGTGSDSTRALRATVMYAPSCDSQLSNYRAATLNIQQSMATGQAVSMALYATGTAGDFGDAGTAPTEVPSPSMAQLIDTSVSQAFGIVDTDPFFQLYVQAAWFVPRLLSPDVQQLLSPTAASTLRDPTSRNRPQQAQGPQAGWPQAELAPHTPWQQQPLGLTAEEAAAAEAPAAAEEVAAAAAAEAAAAAAAAAADSTEGETAAMAEAAIEAAEATAATAEAAMEAAAAVAAKVEAAMDAAAAAAEVGAAPELPLPPARRLQDSPPGPWVAQQWNRLRSYLDSHARQVQQQGRAQGQALLRQQHLTTAAHQRLQTLQMQQQLRQMNMTLAAQERDQVLQFWASQQGIPRAAVLKRQHQLLRQWQAEQLVRAQQHVQEQVAGQQQGVALHHLHAQQQQQEWEQQQVQRQAGRTQAAAEMKVDREKTAAMAHAVSQQRQQLLRSKRQYHTAAAAANYRQRTVEREQQIQLQHTLGVVARQKAAQARSAQRQQAFVQQKQRQLGGQQEAQQHTAMWSLAAATALQAAQAGQQRQRQQHGQELRGGHKREMMEVGQGAEGVAAAAAGAGAAAAAAAGAARAARGVRQLEEVHSRGPADLSQYFGGDSGLAQVSPSDGGVIIPVTFSLYRTLAPGQAPRTLYGRTFHSTACFKWANAANITLLQKPLTAWTNSPGLRSDAARGWGARMVGMDVTGTLVQFETVHGAGVGPTTSPTVPGVARGTRTTMQGCRCKAQWFLADGPGNNTRGSYRGCTRLSGWSLPGCEVVPGTCPPGASLALSAVHDTCAPLRTVSGCRCATSWVPPSPSASSSAPLYGTCAPRDASHPIASWCKVDPATCPSALRAHALGDSSWDYCSTRTTAGCECLNAWTDVNGTLYHGGCVTETDRLRNQTTSWCMTDQSATSAFTSSTGGPLLCPLTWDTCTPLAGRLATSPSGAVVQCLLPGPLAPGPASSPAPLSPAVMYDCVNFNPSLPNTDLPNYCYFRNSSSGALRPAVCLAQGCTPQLRAMCPPTANTATAVAACFEQLCAANVRGAGFGPQTCPADTPQALLLASATFSSMWSANTSATNNTNPWVAQFLASSVPQLPLPTKPTIATAPAGVATRAPLTASEYCTAKYGTACAGQLQAACRGLVVLPGGYGFNLDALACSATCLATACQVQQRIEAGGNTGPLGCADARSAAPLLARLFSFFDIACGLEPSRLRCQQLLVPNPPPAVCPSTSQPDALLSQPFGFLSSSLPALGSLASLAAFTSAPPSSTPASSSSPAASTTTTTPSQPLTASALQALAADAAAAAADAYAGGSLPLYSPYQDCWWVIQPEDPALKAITLEFVFFATEPKYDYLQIWDTEGPRALLTGTQLTSLGSPIASPSSGPTPRLPLAGLQLTTDTGVMLLNFRSDASLQQPGFAATYSAQRELPPTLPTCSPSQRLLSLHLTSLGAGSLAAWALVAASTPCPSPNTITTSPSPSSTPDAAAVLATGGTAPPPTTPTAAAVSSAFPPTAAPLPSFRDLAVHLCLQPGTYRLLRFDITGRGVWAPASAAAAVAEEVVLDPGAAAHNGNGSGLATGAVQALCDTLVVPAKPAGAAPVETSPAPRPQGSHSVSYSLDLLGLSGADVLSPGYAQFKLQQAIAPFALLPYARIALSPPSTVSLPPSPGAASSSGRGRRALRQLLARWAWQGRHGTGPAPHQGGGGGDLDRREKAGHSSARDGGAAAAALSAGQAGEAWQHSNAPAGQQRGLQGGHSLPTQHAGHHHPGHHQQHHVQPAAGTPTPGWSKGAGREQQPRKKEAQQQQQHGEQGGQQQQQQQLVQGRPADVRQQVFSETGNAVALLLASALKAAGAVALRSSKALARQRAQGLALGFLQPHSWSHRPSPSPHNQSHGPHSHAPSHSSHSAHADTSRSGGPGAERGGLAGSGTPPHARQADHARHQAANHGTSSNARTTGSNPQHILPAAAVGHGTATHSHPAQSGGHAPEELQGEGGSKPAAALDKATLNGPAMRAGQAHEQHMKQGKRHAQKDSEGNADSNEGRGDHGHAASHHGGALVESRAGKAPHTRGPRPAPAGHAGSLSGHAASLETLQHISESSASLANSTSKVDKRQREHAANAKAASGRDESVRDNTLRVSSTLLNTQTAGQAIRLITGRHPGQHYIGTAEGLRHNSVMGHRLSVQIIKAAARALHDQRDDDAPDDYRGNLRQLVSDGNVSWVRVTVQLTGYWSQAAADAGLRALDAATRSGALAAAIAATGLPVTTTTSTTIISQGGGSRSPLSPRDAIIVGVVLGGVGLLLLLLAGMVMAVMLRRKMQAKTEVAAEPMPPVAAPQPTAAHPQSPMPHTIHSPGTSSSSPSAPAPPATQGGREKPEDPGSRPCLPKHAWQDICGSSLMPKKAPA